MIAIYVSLLFQETTNEDVNPAKANEQSNTVTDTVTVTETTDDDDDDIECLVSTLSHFDTLIT